LIMKFVTMNGGMFSDEPEPAFWFVAVFAVAEYGP